MSEELMKESRPLRVLIAEDHELTRNGLSFSLHKKGFIVVGEAANGQKAVELALKEKPDIVLMDLGMPLMDGIEATHRLNRENPDIKVVILTSHQEGDSVYASLAAGADAYCLKDIKVDRLVQVLELVADGAIYLDPAIAELVMKALPFNLPEQWKPRTDRQKYNTQLTERELEVLEQIVAGKSNKQIAEALTITVHTTKAHVCNIIHKLAVDDRTQAAVKALRDGLVQKSM